VNSERDLISGLLAMAENPEAFSKAELSAMIGLAANRIRSDAEMMARVRSEIHLAVESMDNVRARTVLANTEVQGSA
jgi:hypothetical protein